MATFPDFSFETAARARGATRIAGVDEAGRGPLAGPVVAAAVILDPKRIPAGIQDSKKLTARARGVAYDAILETSEVATGLASVAEIDSHNILRASHLAMCRALRGLTAPAGLALIDGNLLPRDLPCPGQPVVKGDTLSLSIAAASIVAKVTRDRIMVELAQQYPVLWLGAERGLPDKSTSAGDSRFWCDPTP